MFMRVFEAIDVLDASVLEGRRVYFLLGSKYASVGQYLRRSSDGWHLAQTGVFRDQDIQDDDYIWVDVLDLMG